MGCAASSEQESRKHLPESNAEVADMIALFSQSNQALLPPPAPLHSRQTLAPVSPPSSPRPQRSPLHAPHRCIDTETPSGNILVPPLGQPPHPAPSGAASPPLAPLNSPPQSYLRRRVAKASEGQRIVII